MSNTLFYGDNLALLPQIDDASVDLVYLDPPFNSNRDYNVLFREQSGRESPAQIKAFGDTWNWAGAAEAWADFPALCPVPKVIELMRGFHNTLGENDVMAYLVMMAPRLYHLWRVLKPTGSLYLHCDPTASHYLKLILDGIFGAKNFKNEIIWQRANVKGDVRRKFGSNHDVILLYSKTQDFVFHSQFGHQHEEYIGRFRLDDNDGRGLYRLAPLDSPNPRPNLTYEYKGYKPPAKGWRVSRELMEQLDSDGRLCFPKTAEGRIARKHYVQEQEGPKIGDTWTDIATLQAVGKERLGYPTQKPIALLERIINASSNPGDVVLDPFCGCGTAIVAAQKLGRQWLGIDVTPIATSLIQKRLFDQFEARDLRLLSAADRASAATLARAFRVEGLPTDEAGARAMFEADHKKFEMWAVGLVPAIPQEKKGADGGIDGLAYFDVGAKELVKALVQVKGGKNVGSPGVQQLRGAMSGQSAALGFYVTLEAPTRHMKAEALSAGFYKAATGVGRQVPAMQIRTVAELLSGHHFEFPVTVGSNVSFKSAAAIAVASGQGGLGL